MEYLPRHQIPMANFTLFYYIIIKQVIKQPGSQTMYLHILIALELEMLETFNLNFTITATLGELTYQVCINLISPSLAV